MEQSNYTVWNRGILNISYFLSAVVMTLMMAAPQALAGDLKITNVRQGSGKLFIKVIGTGAKPNSIVLWDGFPVDYVKEDGNINFRTTLIPRGCVGKLSVGGETVDVSVRKCAPDVSYVGLPATGQTISYAEGDDGDERQGRIISEQRFMNNEDGTFTDRLTGIIWLTNVGCMGPVTWDEAHEGALELQSGDCGLTDNSKPGDWKVPNVKEMQTLFDHSSETSVIADDNPINGIILSQNYWSASTPAFEDGSAYGIFFDRGEVLLLPKSTPGGCLVSKKKLKKLFHDVTHPRSTVKAIATDAAVAALGLAIGTILKRDYQGGSNANSVGKDLANEITSTGGEVGEGIIDILLKADRDGDIVLPKNTTTGEAGEAEADAAGHEILNEVEGEVEFIGNQVLETAIDNAIIDLGENLLPEGE